MFIPTPRTHSPTKNSRSLMQSSPKSQKVPKTPNPVLSRVTNDAPCRAALTKAWNVPSSIILDEKEEATSHCREEGAEEYHHHS